MHQKTKDIAVDIEWLARYFSLQAARAGARGGAIAGLAQDLQKMSQSMSNKEFKLAPPQRNSVCLEEKLAALSRQYEQIGAIADKIDAEVSQTRRVVELDDAYQEVSALCAADDQQIRSLVAELTSRHRQLQDSLLHDREQIDLAAARFNHALQARPYRVNGGELVQNNKNPLDRGDGEMV